MAILRPDLRKNEEMAYRSSGGPVTSEIKVAIALRWLAGGSYLDLRMLFKVQTSTIYAVVHEVLVSINARLSIVFPRNDEESRKRISAGFITSRNGGSPLVGCVGALDGISIAIQKP